MTEEQKKSRIRIRAARPEDAAALLAIYRPYVEKTAISFEYEAPTEETFRERITETLRNYPYLLAEEAGEVLGYAYTGPFNHRPAYRWSVETSIYLREDQKKRGLGKRLYRALEAVSKKQHILNMNACIACTEHEDARLSNNSMQFHEHIGYRAVGVFHQCGYKFDTWYDMIWMEKMLGPHPSPAEPVIPFAAFSEAELAALLAEA